MRSGQGRRCSYFLDGAGDGADEVHSKKRDETSTRGPWLRVNDAFSAFLSERHFPRTWKDVSFKPRDDSAQALRHFPDFAPATNSRNENLAFARRVLRLTPRLFPRANEGPGSTRHALQPEAHEIERRTESFGRDLKAVQKRKGARGEKATRRDLYESKEQPEEGVQRTIA